MSKVNGAGEQNDTPISSELRERQRRRERKRVDRERLMAEEQQKQEAEEAARAAMPKNKGGRPRGLTSEKITEQLLSQLEPRERRYVEYRTQGLSKYQAGIKAGFSHSRAKAAVASIESDAVKHVFQEIMRREVPAKKIAKTLRAGLGAVNTQFFQKDGHVISSRITENWPERRKAATIIAQMANYWTPKAELEQAQKVDEATLRKLADIAEKMNLGGISPARLKQLEQSHVPLVIDAEAQQLPEGEDGDDE